MLKGQTIRQAARLLALWTLLLLFLLAAGCSWNEENGEEDGNGNEPPVELKLADYVMVPADTRYTYKGEGNEYAGYTSFVDYTLEDRWQVRKSNAGTTLAVVLELKDGVYSRVYQRGESYYREDYLRNPTLMEAQAGEVLLKEPLIVGNGWTLADGTGRSITALDKGVSTPYGSFEALEVTTRHPDGSVSMDYYAKGLGLVKSVFEGGGSVVTSSLEKVEKNVADSSMVRFFFPDLEEDCYYWKEVAVSFRTNDISRVVLGNAYRGAYTQGMKDAGIGPVFTSGTLVNFLYLGKDGRVCLDLNGLFLGEMNAGAYYESMLLQALVNTFGSYYGSDRVVLTIDGGAYASGHIFLEEGEALRVELEDSRPLE